MNQLRSENFIDELPIGYSNYLKVCIDPYHDRTIRFEGAPTSRTATSVCLCYNQEQTYTAEDFGINAETTPNWDCHFAMFPFLNAHPFTTGYHTNTNGVPTFTVENYSSTIYPMSAHGVASGRPTYAWNIGDSTNQLLGLQSNSLTTFISNTLSDDPASSRTLRIVGEAFEVIDESPEIYQQGSVTVYRYPLENNLSQANLQRVYNDTIFPNDPSWGVGVPAASTAAYPSMGYSLRAPPSNTSSAVLVSGSETWKSRDGCYVIGTQSVSEVPFKQVDNLPINLIGVCPSSSPNYLNGYYCLMDDRSLWQLPGKPNPTSTQCPAPDLVSPFNLSGAYFTGLSSQYAALRLRYRLYVEILTDPSDNTLIPLASATLPYNQSLQELVMNVLSQLPAGCPQTMNPKGEWWKKVLHKVGRVAEDLAGPLSMLSPEVGLILQGGGRLLTASTQQKKKNSNKNAVVPKAATKPSVPSASQPKKKGT